MSQALFFHNQLQQASFQLPEEESKHLVKVLRKTTGDKVQLIDGNGGFAVAIITDAHPKKCSLERISFEQKSLTRKYRFSLAIAPTKNSERIEWMLEKCVEIGLDELFFLQTDNAEREKVNMERLHKIAIAAIKQSKQFHLPILHPPQSLNSYLNETEKLNASKFIAWVQPNLADLKDSIAKSHSNHFHVLIGPEGDFSLLEANLAKEKGFTPISLGPTVLRTETAGIYVCAGISANFNSM